MGGHFLYSLAQYRISALYMLYVSIWYLLRRNGKLLTLCMHNECVGPVPLTRGDQGYWWSQLGGGGLGK